jgi:Arc/MetJ-type ribon-helix-helix transcriptional regulator
VTANAVHIPPVLIARIDKAMEKKGGYTSRAEFVRDSCRRFCDRIEEQAVPDTNKKKKKRKVQGRWP